MKQVKKEITNDGYQVLVSEVVELVQHHRAQAVQVVQVVANRMYWQIGELILNRQAEFGWGMFVVEQLSKDLNHQLGEAQSWSPRNLRFMRQMVEEYSNAALLVSQLRHSKSSSYENLAPNFRNKIGANISKSDCYSIANVKQAANFAKDSKSANYNKKDSKKGLMRLEYLKNLIAEVPWGHNILILQKVKDIEARYFYLEMTVKNHYSRAVLLHQIEADAFGNFHLHPSQHNFEVALPAHLQEQTKESIKSVYMLDFLEMNKPLTERELEASMVEKVKRLMMELGYGFCFIGNQYRLSLRDKDYYIDLLFYHRILKCLVAVDLKVVGFEPEFVGKLDFYLQLIDEQLKQPDDRPSIGILLVPNKDHIEVEYALRAARKPIGVAQYALSKQLPKALRGKLPTASEFRKLLIDGKVA